MANQNITNLQSVAQSPLWKLPPELRIRIYEYALHQSDWCMVTSQHGIPKPALLLACKLIRQEALWIFYAEAAFRADTPAFDPAIYELFARKDETHAGYDHRAVSVYLDPRHPRHWRNLLAWLRGHHAGEFTASLLVYYFHREILSAGGALH